MSLLKEIGFSVAFFTVGALIASNYIPPVVKYVEVPKVELKLVPAGKAEQGPDGFEFERKETNLGELNVKMNYWKSVEDITKQWNIDNPNMQAVGKWQIMGFTSYDGKGNCTINVVDPAIVYMPSTLGHEMFHCIHGDFHPNQPKELVDEWSKKNGTP
jgi:hypothetical protein